MKYNPNIHHRKSIRLKGYDYSQAGLYFITICCQNRASLFGEIKNGEMILNKFGEIALSEWNNTEKIRTNCQIYESIIMPNHIHGIIEITQKIGKEKEIGKFQSPSHSIGSIIRGFKIATIKRIKELIQEISKLEESAPISTGELQFTPRNTSYEKGESAPISTGELQFASRNTSYEKGEPAPINTGELQFASRNTSYEKEESAQISTGELQFAPTEKIKSLNFKIWQRNYYEHIIRNEQAYQNISEYIINNPLNWEKDKLKS